MEFGYDMIELDQRLGTPELHDIAAPSSRTSERPSCRPTCSPATSDPFWEDLKLLPMTMKLV